MNWLLRVVYRVFGFEDRSAEKALAGRRQRALMEARRTAIEVAKLR